MIMFMVIGLLHYRLSYRTNQSREHTPDQVDDVHALRDDCNLENIITISKRTDRTSASLRESLPVGRFRCCPRRSREDYQSSVAGVSHTYVSPPSVIICRTILSPLTEVEMRNLIWIAVIAAFTQVTPNAHAQSDSGTKGGTYDAGPSGAPPPGFSADRLNPTNCGTPDDQKPCGPMPRRALAYYPAGR